jgi:hypothetical protein
MTRNTLWKPDADTRSKLYRGSRKVRAAQRAAVTGYGSRCVDCGEPGKLTGHMECQYPGRVSDRGAS